MHTVKPRQTYNHVSLCPLSLISVKDYNFSDLNSEVNSPK